MDAAFVAAPVSGSRVAVGSSGPQLSEATPLSSAKQSGCCFEQVSCFWLLSETWNKGLGFLMWNHQPAKQWTPNFERCCMSFHVVSIYHIMCSLKMQKIRARFWSFWEKQSNLRIHPWGSMECPMWPCMFLSNHKLTSHSQKHSFPSRNWNLFTKRIMELHQGTKSYISL